MKKSGQGHLTLAMPHTLLGLKKTPEALLEGTPQEKIHPETFDFDWEVLMLGYYEMDRIDGGLFTTHTDRSTIFLAGK